MGTGPGKSQFIFSKGFRLGWKISSKQTTKLFPLQSKKEASQYNGTIKKNHLLLYFFTKTMMKKSNQCTTLLQDVHDRTMGSGVLLTNYMGALYFPFKVGAKLSEAHYFIKHTNKYTIYQIYYSIKKGRTADRRPDMSEKMN